MKTKFSFTLQGVASATYRFERSLNRAVLGLGSGFALLSKKAARTLHTGYWRNYVFFILSAIILFILMNLWIARS
ncbi:MAG: hypothetical protein AB1847_09110 [bacterium]